MPRRKNPISEVKPDVPPDAPLDERFLDDISPFLAGDEPVEDVEEDEQTLFQELTQKKEPLDTVQHYSESILDESAREYLRNQLNRELYGTESPSSHDRELLALKERITRYGN